MQRNMKNLVLAGFAALSLTAGLAATSTDALARAGGGRGGGAHFGGGGAHFGGGGRFAGGGFGGIRTGRSVGFGGYGGRRFYGHGYYCGPLQLAEGLCGPYGY